MCTRDLSTTPHWLQLLHSQDDAGMSRQSYKNKRSIVPKCYPKNGTSRTPAGRVEQQASEKNQFGKEDVCPRKTVVLLEENGNNNGIRKDGLAGARTIKRDQIRRSQAHVSVLHDTGRLRKEHAVSNKEIEDRNNNKENMEDNITTKKRLTRKGTFYGKAQPPSALVPLPPRQSYSDQSDCESLIDDAEIDQDDFEWVNELRDTLGGYIERDFSEIDRLPDRRMQASFDQMMQEEANTSRIGLAVDRREAARESALAKKRRKRKRRLAAAMVISECNDDDATN